MLLDDDVPDLVELLDEDVTEAAVDELESELVVTETAVELLWLELELLPEVVEFTDELELELLETDVVEFTDELELELLETDVVEFTDELELELLDDTASAAGQ